MEAAACQNIGPKERGMRLRLGWIWGALTLVAAVAMVAAQLHWTWRLLVFIPAATSAFGFFQAQANTCVAFAAANIKVLGDSRRDRIQVTDDAERAAFRRKARGISARGLLTAAAVTAVVVALP